MEEKKQRALISNISELLATQTRCPLKAYLLPGLSVSSFPAMSYQCLVE